MQQDRQSEVAREYYSTNDVRRDVLTDCIKALGPCQIVPNSSAGRCAALASGGEACKVVHELCDH